MFIGYRTLKTAVAAALAMWIAEQMKLDYYVFAAIIAILSIQATRKKSIRSSYERIMASILAIGIGFLIFEVVGYRPVALALYFILFLPLTQRLRLQDGFITSVVILTHLYTARQLNLAIFLNEVYLILIGVGVGLLVNMYMPSLDRVITERRQQIDKRIAALFFEVAAAIETGRINHHSLTLEETERLLREGKDASLKRMGNAIGRRNDDEDYSYFRMREQQFELLRGIVRNVDDLVLIVDEGKKVADLFRTIGDNVRPEADASLFLQELADLLATFRASPLPTTREEFEVRSALLHMLQETEQYLQLKQRFVAKSEEIKHRRGKRTK
ncbi:aromatic acid exporter family protein [Exiguobacterium oxidotolerans]|uniref:Putative aromatic acid exporter C-terminal domain-containing protein n=1 Tax=Exiguobacterium oxidotolerans TaxID=223958 RepID=A0A653IFG7_9BACL|nr:aromatic acid exporter family protein [Exiguobacterium oxidotolerans]VWX37950.1 conserved membrane hypothetical protein [Exiguobacterium oxidotolerans]